jgi:geranylgeranyl reductase family protein
MNWDVIIVGAGPAGSTLGYELSRMGIRALIVEKEKFPRYKACAGGLNVKTVKSLDFDISSVVEDTIYGVHITFRMGKQFTNRVDHPIALTVNRERFDHLLLQKAIESGCTVREGEKVESVEIREAGVCVHSSGQTYSGALVAGADGANSVVAKSIGLMQNAFMGVGIESEVEVDAVALERWRNLVLLDLASIRNGYGWIFPKLEHLSIGVCGPLACSKELKAYYKEFTGKWKNAMKSYRVIRKRGHQLPIRKKGARIQHDRVLLVGDAAGLVDPFSGEGIYYAIRSAQLAAGVLRDHLENPQDTSLSKYQALVDQELMLQMQRAKAFARLFNLYPSFFVNALKTNDRLWRAVCKLLTGEKTYVDIGKKLGLFGFILDRIDW